MNLTSAQLEALDTLDSVLKTPDWDCGEVARKQRYLEYWTRAHLEVLDTLDSQAFEAEQNAIIRDPETYPKVRQHLVRRAVEAGNMAELERLIAANPKLIELALTHKRGRGRPKGQGPRPPELRSVLDLAARDVERIQDIWQQQLGHRYRTESPTAVEIAVRRWCSVANLSEEEFKNELVDWKNLPLPKREIF